MIDNYFDSLHRALVEKQLNEGLAFLASFGIFASHRINKLRGIKSPLGNKSTPRNQPFQAIPKLPVINPFHFALTLSLCKQHLPDDLLVCGVFLHSSHGATAFRAHFVQWPVQPPRAPMGNEVVLLPCSRRLNEQTGNRAEHHSNLEYYGRVGCSSCFGTSSGVAARTAKRRERFHTDLLLPNWTCVRSAGMDHPSGFSKASHGSANESA